VPSVAEVKPTLFIVENDLAGTDMLDPYYHIQMKIPKDSL